MNFTDFYENFDQIKNHSIVEKKDNNMNWETVIDALNLIPQTSYPIPESCWSTFEMSTQDKKDLQSDNSKTKFQPINFYFDKFVKRNSQ